VGGRSRIAADLRALIQRMSVENLLWGAPYIHGERLKLGFAVAQSTVVKYMAERGGPFSQGWGTFLRNHAPHIAAMDLFVVPTLGFKLLYVLVIIRLARRELFLRPLSRRRPAPDATRAGVLAAGSVGRTLWGHRSPPRPSRRWSPPRPRTNRSARARHGGPSSYPERSRLGRTLYIRCARRGWFVSDAHPLCVRTRSHVPCSLSGHLCTTIVVWLSVPIKTQNSDGLLSRASDNN